MIQVNQVPQDHKVKWEFKVLKGQEVILECLVCKEVMEKLVNQGSLAKGVRRYSCATFRIVNIS